MLKNYIKIAFKVMLRQKFFTAVSLFGISFTIMIVACVTSIYETIFAPGQPSVNAGRTLYVSSTPVIIKSYIKQLTKPELVSITKRSRFHILNNNKYSNFYSQFTDDAFWKIQKFNFIEGRPFNSQDISQSRQVVVIARSVKENYFGNKPATGQYISSVNTRYRILGVVEDPRRGSDVGLFKIWVPLSPGAMDSIDTGTGEYEALILARSASGFPQIKREIDSLTSGVKLPDLSNVNSKTLGVTSQYEKVKAFFSSTAFILITILLILFMVVPAVNLMSLNVSRISDRSSEIGIRRSFGASSQSLVFQFITENIILTAIGSVIGFFMAYFGMDLLIDLINYAANDDIRHGQFVLNWRMVMYTVFCCLFLGLLSGVYPARKMSKLNPVEALKGRKS